MTFFPSGESAEDYEKCRKWSGRKWAWEFLRRNKNFQIDCDASQNEDDEKLILEKYGLKFYKHYSKPHKHEGKFTRFMIGRPMFYSFDAERAKNGVNLKRVAVKENQFLIKCDFGKGKYYPWITKTLVELIEKRVKKEMKNLSPDHPNFSLKSAITHLRILDLYRNKKNSRLTNPKIYELLYPQCASEDLNAKYNDLMRAAVLVTEESYKWYAVQSRSYFK